MMQSKKYQHKIGWADLNQTDPEYYADRLSIALRKVIRGIDLHVHDDTENIVDKISIVKDMAYEKFERHPEINGKVINSVAAEIKVEFPSRFKQILIEKEQDAIELIYDYYSNVGFHKPDRTYVLSIIKQYRWRVPDALLFFENQIRARLEKPLPPSEQVKPGTPSKPKRSKTSSGTDSKIDEAIRVAELETELTKLKQDLLATTEKLNELKKTTGANTGQDQQKPEDIVDFYFEIFPPGEWKSKDFTQHYKELVRQGKYQEKEVRWKRIREIEKLNPQSRYKGKLKWLGYVVFEFAYTNNVVLECPIEGNAIYILKGSEWKNLIRLTKGEIRDNHVKSYKKVVHRDDWLPRVEAALRDL